MLQFSDDSYEVRLNAHCAIEMCARTNKGSHDFADGMNYSLQLTFVNLGAKGAVEAELIPLCVKKLVDEDKPQLKAS